MRFLIVKSQEPLQRCLPEAWNKDNPEVDSLSLIKISLRQNIYSFIIRQC